MRNGSIHVLSLLVFSLVSACRAGEGDACVTDAVRGAYPWLYCGTGLLCLDGQCERVCGPGQIDNRAAGTECEPLNSREFGDVCTVDQNCVSGLGCPPRDVSPSVCEPLGSRGEGESCGSDSHCGEGLRCGAESTCIAPGTVSQGEGCIDGEDCEDGLRCSGGLCLAPGSVPEGEWCFVEEDCQTGLRCNSGICTTPLPNGAVCERDLDCLVESYCDNELGVCTMRAGLGEPCNFDRPCLLELECVLARCEVSSES